MPASTRPVDILLVDDNLADVRLMAEAFKDGGISNQLHVVNDGAEALRFLRREGPYVSASRPALILLDLNLPKKNGREVLAEIKADPALRRIPVVVLTTSLAPDDVIRSYDLHANCYICKPLDFEKLIQVAGAIERFWLAIVKLPPNGER